MDFYKKKTQLNHNLIDTKLENSDKKIHNEKDKVKSIIKDDYNNKHILKTKNFNGITYDNNNLSFSRNVNIDNNNLKLKDKNIINGNVLDFNTINIDIPNIQPTAKNLSFNDNSWKINTNINTNNLNINTTNISNFNVINKFNGNCVSIIGNGNGNGNFTDICTNQVTELNGFELNGLYINDINNLYKIYYEDHSSPTETHNITNIKENILYQGKCNTLQTPAKFYPTFPNFTNTQQVPVCDYARKHNTCGIGEHIDLDDNERCTLCPANTYQDASNDHQEINCKPQPLCGQGEVLSKNYDGGEDSCIWCTGNTYQDEPAHRKTNCKPLTNCRNIAMFEYYNSERLGDDGWPIGRIEDNQCGCYGGSKYYTNGNGNGCTRCPDNTYQDAALGHRVPNCKPKKTCGPGERYLDRSPLVPGGNRYYDGTCLQCPPNTYQDAALGHRLPNCKPKKTCGPGQIYLDPSPLEPGGNRYYDGTCEQCPRGYYQDNTNHRKTNCKRITARMLSERLGFFRR
jgi:hypothetical protein